ncbi:MAG: hypothetical protein M1812_001565 [Candelaria pacifica]|nr:MAG: hypothetical protein M1812_001565 [Candelaria pacifica]
MSPRIGFLDLPRELRDSIYSYSLIAPEAITVFSGTSSHDTEPIPSSEGGTKYATWMTVHTSSTISDKLALCLLSCSVQVSREGANVFYRQNTFQFASGGNWSPLYTFLRTIGKANRDALRSLEVCMPKPERIRQHSDGTLTTLHDWQFIEVISASALWHNYLTPHVERFVDRFDPAIEACFRLLGKDRPQLTLSLLLDINFLPGVQVMNDEQHMDDFFFRLDVPIMIETCRQKMTTSSDGSTGVQVLYKGECLRCHFGSQLKLIQDAGWVVMAAEDGCVPHDVYPMYTTVFTLQRKAPAETPQLS